MLTACVNVLRVLVHNYGWVIFVSYNIQVLEYLMVVSRWFGSLLIEFYRLFVRFQWESIEVDHQDSTF